MRILLNNSQIFLRRDFLIEGMDYFLENNALENTILKNIDIAPVSVEQSMTILVPLQREDVNKIKSLRPTYCVLNDSDGGNFYYYIDKVRTRSNNALELNLTMDVKNTLFSQANDPTIASSNAYELWKKYVSENSYISREHQKRYNERLSTLSGATIKLAPVINRIDEGIHPQLRCVSLTKIKDTKDDAPYALAFGESYENLIESTSQGNIVIRNYLPFRAYLFRDNSDGNNPKVPVMVKNTGDSPSYDYGYIADIKAIPSGASNLSKILRLPYCPVSKEGSATGTLDLIERDSVTKYSDFPYLTEAQYPSTWHFKGFGALVPAWTGGAHIGELTGNDYFHTDTIATDGVKIEYSNNINGEKDVANINEARAYPLPKFENNDLESIEILPLFTLSTTIDPTSSPRGTIKETKLYNSNFYQVRFIFDSNAFFYESEYLNLQAKAVNVHPIFKVSNSVNSEFIFDFKIDTQVAFDGAYQSIMTITRNLEYTLYNSSFIDYLKSGYNYDKKTQALQAQSDLFNIGVGIGSGVVNSTISSIVNPVSGVSSFIGTGINAVSSIVNNFIQQEARENSFESKMASIMSGSASIASSSDVDILNYYSPKLAYGVYQVITNRQSLEDLFYYYGYSVNAIGRPQYWSRWWFNYIQANLIFDELPLWIDEEMRNNLTEAFSNGIEIIHCRNGNYEFGFDKENVETALLNAFFN